MEITYRNTHDFTPETLADLFLSVEWSSGHFPDRLAAAMRNFETVFSAWDGDRLVGLVSVMDDGIMTAYIQYVLVDPEYQGQGLGRALMNNVMSYINSLLKPGYKMMISLMAAQGKEEFYKKFGFFSRPDDTHGYGMCQWIQQ